MQILVRKGYDILAMFSDWGGQSGMLLMIGYVIVYFFNRDHLDNFIVSKLFKMEKEV